MLFRGAFGFQNLEILPTEDPLEHMVFSGGAGVSLEEKCETCDFFLPESGNPLVEEERFDHNILWS